MGYRDREADRETCPNGQRHVHEIQGSVKLAGERPHEHRFCTVSGEAIPYGKNDHYHEVSFRTDTFHEHYHEFRGKTSCAIPVGDRHIHYIESVTSVDDGHRHRFECATLIENPTGRDHRDNDYRYGVDRNENLHDKKDYKYR